MTLHQVRATTRKYLNPKEAAEALFAKRAAPKAVAAGAVAPRILEDAPKPVVVETRRSRGAAARAAAGVKPIDHAVVAVVAGLPEPISHDGEHARVVALIAEGDIKQAARIAARLINNGNVGGFFVYGGTRAFAEATARHEALISKSSGEAATVVTVTPEFAQVLLLNNSGNRRVGAKNLEDIMRDMIGGHWALNGESLIVSSDGKLNDGQHRCYAALLARWAFRTTLSFGVERATIGTVNIGKKRTGSDRLGIAGVKNSVPLSALSTLLFELIHKRKPTPAETDAYYSENEAQIVAANACCGDNMKGVGRAAAGGAAFYLLERGYLEDEIRSFFTSIRSGEMMAKRDPRMVLHKAIYDSRMKIKLSRENWVSAFVAHFFAHKGQKSVSSVTWEISLTWEI